MSQKEILYHQAAPPADRDRHFRTGHLKSDLAGRTARGGSLMIAAQGFKFTLNMASAVVLARLLSPIDYGLIGMVAVVTNFSYPFRNLGLSAATIQKEEIKYAQVSTLFWINVALSVVVMLATAAIAPLVASFYGEPRLTWITLALAGGFVFGGLTVQHEALLKRQMRFASLAAIEITSLLVGTATAIIAAWYGAGYWALVYSNLTTGFTTAVGVWIACRWRPSLPSRGAGVRSMLAFGRNLTGYNVINYVSRNLDNLLIGRFWGAQQLGLYARAYQLLLLPLDQIGAPLDGVAVTALSRLTDSPERYRKAYTRILEKLAMITMPGIALMIGTSDWLVRIMLGPQWGETARIFALLGIVGLIEPVANTIGWLLISQARTRQVFQWGLIDGAISIASIVAGLPWGALGVAASYAVVGLAIRKPLLFWFAGRTGPVRTADVYRAIAPSACAALSVLAAIFLFRRWADVTSPLTGLIVCAGIALAAALLVFFVLPAGRRALRDAWSLLPALFKRRSHAQ